jgi:hypothetical protein
LALFKEKGCVALKADKGNAIVILKEVSYKQSMEKLLEEGPYVKVNKSPLKKNINSKHGVKLSYLQHSNPEVPLLYGLPKIHKPGNKMRPINSNNNAPTEKLAKWPTRQLKQIPDPPGMFVKNTFEQGEEHIVGPARRAGVFRRHSTLPERADG